MPSTVERLLQALSHLLDTSSANSFSSIQSLSHVRLSATPWTATLQASLSIANSRSLLKLMSIESVMPSNHLILCRPLLLLPSIFPSIRVFSKESALCIRGPKYWSFSFSISPSYEYSGLISFRMGWLDLLAVQGTFKSLLQLTCTLIDSAKHTAIQTHIMAASRFRPQLLITPILLCNFHVARRLEPLFMPNWEQ